MNRFSPLAFIGFSLLAVLFSSPIMAHQTTATKQINVVIHLDPDDSPYAGKATLTWLMLTRKNGDMVAPASCHCRVAAYDAQNRSIAEQLPLTPLSMAGHQAGHQAIQTQITFPRSGVYTVVVTGQSKDGSFEPFELKFPVKVRP